MKYTLAIIFTLCMLSVSARSLPLYGTWRFHTGDNSSWATPSYNDTAWEQVDLTPMAGAHDGDVGLSNFVNGWQLRGHRSYAGFAWYRLKMPMPKNQQGPLVLTGPAAADDIYQVFVDGKLIGGIGDFSSTVPVMYGIQPKLFILPPIAADTLTIAIRVWASRLTIAGDPTSGGVRIAPILGPKDDVYPLYRQQWRQTFWGYVVDAVEPLLFLILAILSLTFGKRPFYRWLAVSLILTALVRASQVFYFWGQWESLTLYIISKEVLLVPLCFAAWLITWSLWYDLKMKWLNVLVAIVCIAYIATRFFSGVWQYDTIDPHAAAYSQIIHLLRIAFLLMMAFIVIAGIVRQKRFALLHFATVLLLSIGLFAGELSAIGIKGIWFPFGVGVSRTQYAYALLAPLLLILLLKGRKRTGH